MRNEDGMTPLEQELEAALGGLRPAPSGLNRDGLMFEAGRTTQRRHRFWQGLSATLAVLLAVSVVSRSRPVASQSTPKTIARARANKTPAAVPYSQTEQVDRRASEAFRQYVNIRQAVINRGVEALPASPAMRQTTVAPPLTREDMEDLLSST